MKKTFTRRDFLKLASAITAAASLPGELTEVFAAGMEKLVSTTSVIWLQGQSCSGDSISMLNTIDPEPSDLLTRYINLAIHQNIGAAQGHVFIETLQKAIQTRNYIMVIEGSIPADMPKACVIGGKPFEDILKEVIPGAKAVIAAGTCATFGGIPAAEGNPTGSCSVLDFMKKNKLSWDNKLINCTGCPIHPDAVVGTLAYIAQRGYPQVDPVLLTPNMFYSHSTHDNCPRYHYYERKIFASHFGDPQGCLFQLGCLGPLTKTECPNRQWNSSVNWCVRAAAPCIGCSSPHFAKKKNFPFYRIGEHAHRVEYTESQRKGESL